MSDDFIFTSESMTAGHPDKLCDQISDAIVDQYLIHDASARIVAESVVASGVLFISTHFASQAVIDIAETARQVIRDIGYPKSVFDADACTIMTSPNAKSEVNTTPIDAPSSTLPKSRIHCVNKAVSTPTRTAPRNTIFTPA